MLLNDYKDTHWSENSFDFPARAFVFKRLKETYGKRNRFIWKRAFSKISQRKCPNRFLYTFRKMFGGIKVRALIRGAHLQEPSNIE